MAVVREWLDGISTKGIKYKYCNGEHVGLTELREDFPEHNYLGKESIPRYPEYVFQESNVCHVTEKSGLHGIFTDSGFRGGNDGYLWWSLSISDDSMQQNPFATSPAFQTESRYGNFRFTFRLTELLKQYSKQFCSRTAPILRVLDTKLYRKEIVYSVLVHPQYMRHYRKYPRLPVDIEPDTDLCGYSQKTMTWHCQSPSDNYEYGLEKNEDDVGNASPLDRREYFVWDKVAVAFHMKKNWVLRLDRSQLLEHLSVCEVAQVNLLNNKEEKMSVKEAQEEVKKLKRKFNL
ncbi:uncharacterized protein LOC131343933 [Hemibagrus wyckioides]|uniref:uncharacterized protein LOC131343933 n=1 Tax=Hemibagrus wyckioides TaxID=337641 RepID=UPI00266BA4DE|nr:uncharacterized protein LOC131343933 [Hemibagrus wyckioides]